MTLRTPGQPDPKHPRVLLTGATGFVGTHLYPSLIMRGYDVLCGTRDVKKAREQYPHRHFCRLDMRDPASVEAALAQVERAFYLVHSMADDGDFRDAERREASIFRDAAERMGLERIVYLGGMRPRGRLSAHLASRLSTGEILRGGSVPTVELQASMIVGGGSESFRIVRDLAARLPVMLLPRWLGNVSEPVALDDVIAALVHALAMPLDKSIVLSAPGPEALSGKEMIVRTARALGHEPKVVDVPLVTPRLSSYWIRWVTRANARVATELVEGLRSDVTAGGEQIWDRLIPAFRRTPFDEAVQRALGSEERGLSVGARRLERALHRMGFGGHASKKAARAHTGIQPARRAEQT